jgi:predicted MFS family arabinose efflux permease
MGERASFLREFQAGLREVIANGVARWIMFLVGSTLFASAIMAMRPVLAKQVFNVGALGFGTMGAFFGVGVIGGALIAANLSTRVKNKAWIVLIGGLVYYGGEVLYGLAPTYQWVLPCELLLGLSGTVVGSYMFPLAQLAVPREVQGRAVSIIYALQPLMFVGQLFAGLLADHIGPRWTLALFGAAAVTMYLFATARGTLVKAAATVEFG